MAWDKGFNFRATSGYVTDGADETYVLGSDTYPTTRNGATFGLYAGTLSGARDRNSGIDRRFAGGHFESSGDTDYRFDLPSTGDYEIRLACGDYGSGSPKAYLTMLDNATSFKDFGSAIPINNGWRRVVDADENTWGDGVTSLDGITEWIANNVAVTRTFTSTIFILRLKAATNTFINHLRITQISAGGNAPGGRSRLACRTAARLQTRL